MLQPKPSVNGTAVVSFVFPSVVLRLSHTVLIDVAMLKNERVRDRGVCGGQVGLVNGMGNNL